jgi:hypothetical protein
MTVNFRHRDLTMNTRILISLLTMLCSQIPLAQLTAQSVVFNTRNGANTAYCGATPGGPGLLHRFSLPEPTHDVIAVSDPGATNMPQSSAASQLDVTASNSGITIAAAGSAGRGPLQPFIDFGAAAVADARDNWEFTLEAPARFTFNGTMTASSADASGATGGFVFGAHAFNQIIPDPGTPPGAFGGILTNSGTVVSQGKGRLLAGRYIISFNCRVDGNNIYPFSGSFDFVLALGLGPDVPAIVRTQILPHGLEIEWTDPGPNQYTVETSSSLSGDNWTPVSGVAWPISDHTILLPPPQSSPAFYRVKME